MKYKYNVLAIISGIFIGFSLVFSSFAAKTVHPLVFSTLSPLLSVIPLLIMVRLFNGDGIREFSTKNRRDFILLMLERGIISGLIMIFGLSMTIAIRASFVVQIESAFVFIWSILLLKERVRKSKVFLLTTLIIGAFMITTNGNIGVLSSFLVGDILILIALIMLSHSYLLSARIMKNANPIKLVLSFMIFSVPVSAVLAFVFLPIEAFIIPLDYLVLLAASSFSFNIIGFPLWMICLKHLRPWTVSAMIVVQTISGAILSYVWLGQGLSIIQVIGGVVILISAYLISLKG